MLGARERAARLGATPIGAAGGATLCFLAATIGARAVVEVGTGTGRERAVAAARHGRATAC